MYLVLASFGFWLILISILGVIIEYLECWLKILKTNFKTRTRISDWLELDLKPKPAPKLTWFI